MGQTCNEPLTTGSETIASTFWAARFNAPVNRGTKREDHARFFDRRNSFERALLPLDVVTFIDYRNRSTPSIHRSITLRASATVTIY